MSVLSIVLHLTVWDSGSMNVELANLAKLAALAKDYVGMLLSPPLQHWDCKHILSCQLLHTFCEINSGSQACTTNILPPS